MTEQAWTIRPHEAADLPFIFDSWVKSYWDGINREPWPQTVRGYDMTGVIGQRLNRDLFYTPGQRHLAAACIAAAPCYVAHVRDNPDQLMGFACGGSGWLHYVYVKTSFRRLGVARSLIQAALGDAQDIKVSHLTKHVDRVLVGRGWVHVPNWEKP